MGEPGMQQCGVTWTGKPAMPRKLRIDGGLYGNDWFIAACVRKDCVLLRVHYNQKEKMILHCIGAPKPQTLNPINSTPHLAQGGLSSPITRFKKV